MLNEVIKKVTAYEDLTEEEAYEAVNKIMDGRVDEAQMAAFLVALKMKGETAEEITGAAKAMREHALKVELKSPYAIDTCGTGGDGAKTFNISTAASIIAAAGGVKVAKHGNRSVSSKSGSADVLSELHIDIELNKEEVEKSIDEKGMGFIFAQIYHKAMKNVGPVRKQLGVRTLFNILGPITNPCDLKGQVLGVYDKKLIDVVSKVLVKLGRERAIVMHGSDGLDEITTTGETYVTEIRNNEVKSYTITPEQFGIKRAFLNEIEGGTPEENADIILDILKGKKGAKRDIVVLNSAAALYVGKAVEDLKAGVKLAEKLIDDGTAYEKYQQLVGA
ncbi:anthranilate phosphoribosyltransferase [Clostridium guangxiense]|uniref:anthranilate phosphoribosyltransferase n=1 Tax=Clostridium guangxiense TaxID=1662055 RepID=UPI001E3AEBB1|nr:anthranilate phosphoribosyltransferase [Clostridium guangxiense]MCD2348406.1 anthranilate phosphoribosyltransferase [Clostridium guangxiense]